MYEIKSDPKRNEARCSGLPWQSNLAVAISRYLTGHEDFQPIPSGSSEPIWCAHIRSLSMLLNFVGQLSLQMDVVIELARSWIDPTRVATRPAKPMAVSHIRDWLQVGWPGHNDLGEWKIWTWNRVATQSRGSEYNKSSIQVTGNPGSVEEFNRVITNLICYAQLA